MSDSWVAIDEYLADLFLPHDSVLKATLAASVAAGLPQIQISPIQGKFLQFLARLRNARNILEIGTLGGYSTIWLARGLAPGGKLITLEYEPKHAEIARANIASAGLAEVVEIRIGAALTTLPQLADERRGPFDLIFIDADKENYPQYLDWALQLAVCGSLIVADNVLRHGAIINENDDSPDVVAMRRFNELFASEQRLLGTALQVVGTKGHDGLAMAVVVA